MLKRSLQNMMNLTEFVKTLTLVSLKHLNILNSSVILTKFSKSTSYFIYIYVIYVYACAYVQMCIYQSFSSSKLFLLQAIYLFRKKCCELQRIRAYSIIVYHKTRHSTGTELGIFHQKL